MSTTRVLLPLLALVGLLVAATALPARPDDAHGDLDRHARHGHVDAHHRLTLDGARAVLRGAAAKADALGAGGAIAVVDAGGTLMLLERRDGTFAAASRVSEGKARTSAAFGKPTSVFETIVNDGRTTMVALPDFTPLQGGLPLVIDGLLVGAVGVSGAASAAQDEEVAAAGVAALLSTP
jgi:uncharacterized protein GlcG (DUF336 family)